MSEAKGYRFFSDPRLEMMALEAEADAKLRCDLRMAQERRDRQYTRHAAAQTYCWPLVGEEAWA